MKSELLTFTYQTRIILTQDQEAILDDYALVMGQVERKLFAAISAGNNINDLKSQFIAKFGITARQFNACRAQVEGKIASIKELRANQIVESKSCILGLEKKIQKLERKKEANALIIHQKKRRLSSLRSKLNNLIADEKSGTVRICFGSKKLFRAQFDLKANKLASHEEWRDQW